MPFILTVFTIARATNNATFGISPKEISTNTSKVHRFVPLIWGRRCDFTIKSYTSLLKENFFLKLYTFNHNGNGGWCSELRMVNLTGRRFQQIKKINRSPQTLVSMHSTAKRIWHQPHTQHIITVSWETLHHLQLSAWKQKGRNQQVYTQKKDKLYVKLNINKILSQFT